MDIRKFSRKRPCSSESTEAPTDEQDTAQPCSSGDLPPTNPPGISKAKQRKVYKARLSYKKQWEQTYPWVYCKDPSEGMFCKLCQKRGNPPPTARGAWTTRGMKDWNHATEQLKEHSQSKSKWHRDAIIYARMAEQGEQQSVVQLLSSAAAKEAEERHERIRAIVLKLLRSIYFLAKNCLPLTTTFDQLVQLQMANGDTILEHHIETGPRNAQYTSKFSAVRLLIPG